MPFIPTADEWLTLSAQLLEARPATTRISTRYSISAAKKLRIRKSKQKQQQQQQQDAGAAAADTPMPDAKPPRAKLILKTFDPHSGVCLKYKTAKAQEVGRLVAMLGSLGRNMAALPAALPSSVEQQIEDAAATAAGTATPPVGDQQKEGAAAPAPATGGGGGGKKKKKGKR